MKVVETTEIKRRNKVSIRNLNDRDGNNVEVAIRRRGNLLGEFHPLRDLKRKVYSNKLLQESVNYREISFSMFNNIYLAMTQYMKFSLKQGHLMISTKQKIKSARKVRKMMQRATNLQTQKKTFFLSPTVAAARAKIFSVFFENENYYKYCKHNGLRIPDPKVKALKQIESSGKLENSISTCTWFLKNSNHFYNLKTKSINSISDGERKIHTSEAANCCYCPGNCRRFNGGRRIRRRSIGRGKKCRGSEFSECGSSKSINKVMKAFFCEIRSIFNLFSPALSSMSSGSKRSIQSPPDGNQGSKRQQRSNSPYDISPLREKFLLEGQEPMDTRAGAEANADDVLSTSMKNFTLTEDERVEMDRKIRAEALQRASESKAADEARARELWKREKYLEMKRNYEAEQAREEANGILDAQRRALSPILNFRPTRAQFPDLASTLAQANAWEAQHQQPAMQQPALDIANERFQLLVVPNGYPVNIINEQIFSNIESNITDALSLVNDQGMVAQVAHRFGGYFAECIDHRSIQKLKDILALLRWDRIDKEGTRFHIVNPDEVLHPKEAEIYVPTKGSNYSTASREAANAVHCANKSNWKLIKTIDYRNQIGKTFVTTIDDESFSHLDGQNGKIERFNYGGCSRKANIRIQIVGIGRKKLNYLQRKEKNYYNKKSFQVNALEMEKMMSTKRSSQRAPTEVSR